MVHRFGARPKVSVVPSEMVVVVARLGNGVLRVLSDWGGGRSSAPVGITVPFLQVTPFSLRSALSRPAAWWVSLAQLLVLSTTSRHSRRLRTLNEVADARGMREKRACPGSPFRA